jgi:NitT/TauT family transport system substrate-binding protein
VSHPHHPHGHQPHELQPHGHRLHASNSAVDRRRFLRLIAGTGLVAAGGPTLLAACGGSSDGAGNTTVAPTDLPASLGSLKIGYLPITDASPLLVAHATGALADQGFEANNPTLFRSWADIVEAFQAEQVDVVHLLMPLAVQLRFGANLPVKVVAWNHTNGSALTAAERITDVTDLAGETVAIPFWWSIHNVVLQKLLRANGLTPIIQGNPSQADGTVKLVIVPPADMVPALVSGSIAAFIVADPFNALAEVNDVGRILRFTGDVWRDHACCVTVVSENFLGGREGAGQALVNALAASQLTIADDRPGAAQLLSDGGYLPQSVVAIERALTHYATEEYFATGAIQNEEWESERIGFQPYAFPSYTQELVRSLRDTLIDGDTAFLADLDDATAHAELVAEGLAKSAIEANGGAERFKLASFERVETVAP